MSIDYDTDADGDWYDGDDGTACTWCGGDGIGDGCGDEIQCCGRDVCHCCSGTGLRSEQTVF